LKGKTKQIVAGKIFFKLGKRSLNKNLLGILETEFWCNFYLYENIIFLASIWIKYHSIWIWKEGDNCKSLNYVKSKINFFLLSCSILGIFAKKIGTPC